MNHSIAFKFEGLGEKSAEGQKIYRAIASTAALDRDREVLVPKGCVTDEFKKNPVMLFIHNYRSLPVGKVLNLDVSQDSVKFDFVFTDDDIGKQLENLYNKGFMNAFSVGFYPLDYKRIDNETPNQFDVQVADGSTQSFDLTRYKTRPNYVVNKWELLEISPVPVPSNPEALLVRAKEEVIRKFYDGQGKKSAVAQLIESRVNSDLDVLMGSVNSFLKSLEDVKISRVVPYEKFTIDEEANETWDVTKTMSSFSRWASEDGSGAKEAIDWGKYVKGFAWVNTADPDKFISYRYPHHIVANGEIKTVWKGVAVAMANVLTAKATAEGDVLSELKQVYDHLAEHYKDFGKEAPVFDGQHSAEDIEKISAGVYEKSEIMKPEQKLEKQASGEPDSDETPDPSHLHSKVDALHTKVDSLHCKVDNMMSSMGEDAQKAFSDRLSELEQTMNVRLSIVVTMLNEISQVVKAVQVEDASGNTKPSDEEKNFESEMISLREMLTGLSSLTD